MDQVGSLVQSNATKQIIESRIVAQRIVARLYFQHRHSIGMLGICSFLPGERLLPIVHVDVGPNNC